MTKAPMTAYEELLDLLSNAANPEDILKYMPSWETVARVEYLIKGYRAGILNGMEIAELDAIMEVAPFIRAYRLQAEQRKQGK